MFPKLQLKVRCEYTDFNWDVSNGFYTTLQQILSENQVLIDIVTLHKAPLPPWEQCSSMDILSNMNMWQTKVLTEYNGDLRPSYSFKLNVYFIYPGMLMCLSKFTTQLVNQMFVCMNHPWLTGGYFLCCPSPSRNLNNGFSNHFHC